MKTQMLARIGSGFLLGCLLGLTGCVTPPQKTPVFQAASFSAAEVDETILLPVVDLRPDKSVGLDVKTSALSSAKGVLKQKKYKFTVHMEDTQVSGLTDEDLNKPKSEWIKALNPANGRWVMVVAVNDLVRKVTLGTAANAEVSAYLFDKEAGKCVWHDKGVGQAGQRGLIGYLNPSASEAMQIAICNAILGLPSKPKQPK